MRRSAACSRCGATGPRSPCCSCSRSTSCVTGALDILGVAYAEEVLALAEDGAGLLIGSLGVGGLIGAFAGASLSQGRRLARVVIGGAVLEGAAFALVPVWGLLLPAAVTLALTGFGGAATRGGRSHAAAARHRRPHPRARLRRAGEHGAARHRGRRAARPAAHRPRSAPSSRGCRSASASPWRPSPAPGSCCASSSARATCPTSCRCCAGSASSPSCRRTTSSGSRAAAGGSTSRPGTVGRSSGRPRDATSSSSPRARCRVTIDDGRKPGTLGAGELLRRDRAAAPHPAHRDRHGRDRRPRARAARQRLPGRRHRRRRRARGDERDRVALRRPPGVNADGAGPLGVGRRRRVRARPARSTSR